MKIHPYHFSDVQMHRLLRNFLKCARLTGHEKLVALIEQDMEASSGESMKAVFDSAPAVVAYSLDVKSGEKEGKTVETVLKKPKRVSARD